MLEEIMSTGERRNCLSPNNLLKVHEADALQSVEYLASVHRGVPHIRDLQTGNEFERRRPIRDRIARNTRLGVPFDPSLHVGWLGWTVLVDSSPVPPLRVEVHPV